jgi:hypothetical protein
MVTNTRQQTPQRLQVGVVAFVWLAGANSKNCAQLFRRFAAAMQTNKPPLFICHCGFYCHLDNALNNALITTSALSDRLLS